MPGNPPPIDTRHQADLEQLRQELRADMTHAALRDCATWLNFAPTAEFGRNCGPHHQPDRDDGHLRRPRHHPETVHMTDDAIRREIQRLVAAHEELLAAIRIAHARHREAFDAYEAMLVEALSASGVALGLLDRLLNNDETDEGI